MRSIAVPLAALLAAGAFLPTATAACEPRQDAYRLDDHYALLQTGPGYDQVDVPPMAIRDGMIAWSVGQWVLVYEETNGHEGLQTDAKACRSGGVDRLVAKSYFGYGGATIQI